MSEKEIRRIGRITHFFSKINVAVIELSEPLSLGEKILFQGANTYFEQEVVSMQIEYRNINTAKGGESIGLKVDQRVREGDVVFKII
jgi:putative protease